MGVYGSLIVVHPQMEVDLHCMPFLVPEALRDTPSPQTHPLKGPLFRMFLDQTCPARKRVEASVKPSLVWLSEAYASNDMERHFQQGDNASMHPSRKRAVLP